MKAEATAHFNPRFVAYARAHGRTALAQLEHDRREYVACMTGFTLWVSAKKREFKAAHPEAFFSSDSSTGPIVDLLAWDRFLGVTL